jgi:hypothetical protein
MATRGYLILASSHLRYLEMAVDLALSLRQFNADPVQLLTDETERGGAPEAYLAQFDQVALLPPGYPGYCGKLYAGQATAFDKTIMIDADSLAIGGLAEFWAAHEDMAFGLQGEPIDASLKVRHHLRSVPGLIRRFGLETYFKSLGALILFERDAGQEILGQCDHLYRTAFRRRAARGRTVPDELLLGIVGGRNPKVGRIRNPLPMPWSAADARVRDSRFKLLHFNDAPDPAVADWLSGDIRARRRHAGLPEEASLPHWQTKMRQSGRLTRLRLLFERDVRPRTTY